jgi:hypothetical protein
MALKQPIDAIFNYFEDKYCVVVHYVYDDDLKPHCIWIANESLQDALRTDKVMNNTACTQAIQNCKGRMRIEIVNTFSRRIDARKHAFELMARMRPVSHKGRIRMRPVRCIDTGDIYNSAAAAAAANNISNSAMSNHLNGRKNYIRIHGMKFEWITTE